MKEIRKTYASRGLLEWHVMLKADGVTLGIDFAGGTMGANGIIPGRYVTSNPAIQRLIEASPQYRCGRIYEISGWGA